MSGSLLRGTAAIKSMNTYLFFRKDGFYMVELQDDQDAKHNAEINSGTVRVETANGKVIWADNNRWN